MDCAPMEIHLRNDTRIYPLHMSTARKIPLHFEDAADEFLKELISDGVIESVDLPKQWCSPAHCSFKILFRGTNGGGDFTECCKNFHMCSQGCHISNRDKSGDLHICFIAGPKSWRMGSKSSKASSSSEGTQVTYQGSTEERGGFQVLELHSPSVGAGMLTLFVMVVIVVALWFLYRHCA